MKLAASYRIRGGSRIIAKGRAVTVDISCGGVLFEAAPLGQATEFSLLMVWPASLDDGTLLQLFIAGPVVRSDGRRAAIRNARHEFRALSEYCGLAGNREAHRRHH